MNKNLMLCVFVDLIFCFFILIWLILNLNPTLPIILMLMFSALMILFKIKFDEKDEVD